MNKKQYEVFKRLREDDIPIYTDGVNDYTAKDIYKKKMPLIPESSIEPNWDLLQKRIEVKFDKGRLMTYYTMNGEVTPENQVEEVKKRSAKGYEYMLQEHKLLEYILSR